MIRCINRLEEHQEGKIVVDGIELTGNLKNIDSVRKEVADRFLFFDEGLIVEEGTPDHFFNNPKEDRTKLFLSQILNH